MENKILNPKEAKMKYTVKRSNGYVFSEIFTLQEIEKGCVPEWMNMNLVSEKELKREMVNNKE